MSGARPVVTGFVAAAADPSPCLLCVDSLPVVSGRRVLRQRSSSRQIELSSSFVGTWHGRRTSASRSKQGRSCKSRGLVVVGELAGQYEESFEDVHVQLINYFTYKATRTVLYQLYEMNPTNYRWFYDFVASNKPSDGKQFLRTLGKEKQELAERVMITRLHLYGQWVKKLDHAKMYQRISDENLQLMRERLIETVIWPTDDTNTEMLG